MDAFCLLCWLAYLELKYIYLQRYHFNTHIVGIVKYLGKQLFLIRAKYFKNEEEISYLWDDHKCGKTQTQYTELQLKIYS